MNITENPILKSFKEVEEIKLVPAGYLPIKLSTKGKVGAPILFHMRNLNTSEVLTLSLTAEDDIPERLLEILNEAIFEDIDIFAFHENEIIETIIILFTNFYSPVVTGVPFNYTEEDLAYLDKQGKSKADLLNGNWKPTIDINIIKDVETYDLDEAFKPSALVTNKKSGFSCEFRLPKYGDVALLKKWLKENFGDKDKAFSKTKQLIELKSNFIDRFESGETVDLSRLPVVLEDDLKGYENLQKEKAAALVDVIRAMHLTKFETKDVSNLSLSERIELVKDSRIDFSFSTSLDQYFNNLKFGIKPDIHMINPITGEEVTRPYSFRLLDILQAMQVQSSSEYDIVFGS